VDESPSFLGIWAHPWSTIRRIQGLDRTPDRRIVRTPRGPSDEPDPLRAYSTTQAQALYKALGLNTLEESRLELHLSFREMDTDPIIAAVLDAYGMEGGQYDPEHKRVVWVESKNSDIRTIATRTLDRTKTDDNAFPDMRSLARDGDVLKHVALQRGEGIVALRPYDPWTVARVEDKIGRLIGFSPADDQGKPIRKDTHSVGPHQVLHFRLPPREMTDIYGVKSSFLYGSRVTWREFQLMEDQVVIQRLLRRPDRLLVLMDGSGMSHDEAWRTLKDYERRMHREWHLNPQSGFFQSSGLALDMARDLVLPRGPNNQTQIENFPATNQNDLLRDLDFILARIAAGIGFPLGFIGRGEQQGVYQPGASLSRQYQPFAKRAALLQRCYISELVRMVMIDLAYKNIDPFRPENEFTLNMASVAPIVEIERAEVIQLRMDRMERAIQFGSNAGLDMNVWIPFVLEKYGGLPVDLIGRLYVGAKGGDTSERHAPPDMKALNEALDVAWAEIMPAVEENVAVSSRGVSIGREWETKHRGVLAESKDPAKASLPEAVQDPHFSVPDVEEPLARSMVGVRETRMHTRMRLVSALAGLPVPDGVR
jgi:hypothetical protein